MVSRSRARRRAVVAPLAVALGLSGCAGAPAPDELLDVMPAPVVERGVHVSAGPGAVAASRLPLAGLDAFGVDVEDIEAVAETGGGPLTVLGGGVRRGSVSGAVTELGWSTESREGWLVAERGPDIPAGAPPLVVSVPALAARRGVLVLGSAEEVSAAVEGVDPMGSAPATVSLLGALDALDGEVTWLLLGAPRGADPAEEGAGIGGALGSHGGWLIAADDTGGGLVALAGPPGEGALDLASELVFRLASGARAGPSAELAGNLERDVVEADRESGVAVVRGRWRDPEALHALRGPAGRGELLILEPGDA